MDDKVFGFESSKTSELFNISFEQSKRVQIGNPIDLESKADCLNSRECVAFFDWSTRYEKLKSENSEAGDEMEYSVDQSAHAENVKCAEPVATSENVK
jgi:hypothetical protein